MALDERVFKRRRRRRPQRNIGSSTDATLSEEQSSSLFRFLSEDTEIRIQPFEEIPEQEQEEPPPPNDNNHSMPQLSLLALLTERELAGMAVQSGTRTIRQRQAKQRTIKFTELGTSASTAVLGLDRTGSFLLALAAAASSEDEEDDNNNNNALVLQMLGLPSPAALSRPGHRGPTLLLQIPLPYNTSLVDNIEGEESNWFSQPSPVQTAVRIWLADDERLGICMYRDTAAMSTGSSPVHGVRGVDCFGMRCRCCRLEDGETFVRLAPCIDIAAYNLFLLLIFSVDRSSPSKLFCFVNRVPTRTRRLRRLLFGGFAMSTRPAKCSKIRTCFEIPIFCGRWTASPLRQTNTAVARLVSSSRHLHHHHRGGSAAVQCKDFPRICSSLMKKTAFA